MATLQADLTALIHATYEGKYYDSLLASEPSINWLGFASKVYKKSQSLSSVVTYLRNCYNFRAFLQTLPNKPTIAELMNEIKQDKENNLLYRTLDDFTTWSGNVKNYRPATTWLVVASIKKLLAYYDIEIESARFKNKVDMPTNRPLREEYPSNEIIRKIIDACSVRLRVWVQLLCDTGLEPVDAAQLKLSSFKFDEDPVRISIEREKTSEPITAFINYQTAEGIKMLTNGKGPDDFVFTKMFTFDTTRSIRSLYNEAVKRAGLNEKISGHRYGKYHFKIYKKRWFSEAIKAGVPEYIVMGMLGRKKYLDQYMALTLDDKRAYAKKILKKVSIYADKADKTEIARQMAQVMGVAESDMTDAKLAALQGILAKVGQFAKLPTGDLEQINKLLGGENK